MSLSKLKTEWRFQTKISGSYNLANNKDKGVNPGFAKNEVFLRQNLLLVRKNISGKQT